jgi:hypothetical protein
MWQIDTNHYECLFNRGIKMNLMGELDLVSKWNKEDEKRVKADKTKKKGR